MDTQKDAFRLTRHVQSDHLGVFQKSGWTWKKHILFPLQHVFSLSREKLLTAGNEAGPIQDS